MEDYQFQRVWQLGFDLNHHIIHQHSRIIYSSCSNPWLSYIFNNIPTHTLIIILDDNKHVDNFLDSYAWKKYFLQIKVKLSEPLVHTASYLSVSVKYCLYAWVM